jgi:hypothetical protein
MDTSKLWRASALSPSDDNPTYRAEIVRREPGGPSSIYYDGGEFVPYCVESLMEILRSEVRKPHELLDVCIEIKGTCNSSTVRDLARRFDGIREPRLHVRISAPGHPGVVIAPELQARRGAANTSGQHKA